MLVLRNCGLFHKHVELICFELIGVCRALFSVTSEMILSNMVRKLKTTNCYMYVSCCTTESHMSSRHADCPIGFTFLCIVVELTVADRRNKKEIRHLENELPKWQVLVDSVTGERH